MILTFGEVMLRIAPEGVLRFRQALPGRMEMTFGGGEANVAFSLAQLGADVRYLTALPKHPVADALLAALRGGGVDVHHVLRRDKGRLGIYYLETGANQRSSNVIYDRSGSAAALAGPDEYDFDAALADVTWLHITGITPAISEAAYRSTLALAQAAQRRGASVSCDLNFRKKLWQWEKGTAPRDLARRCMAAILPFVDVTIGNEEDASDVLDIRAEGAEIDKGRLCAEAYECVAREIVSRFPNVSRVAVTLRESLSATHNNWGGMLFDAGAGTAFFAPRDERGAYRPYEIRNIVDRVGGGDSFAAGLICMLATEAQAGSEAALRFAVASSCLKHSILGDFNYVSRDEVEKLVKGQASGRVQR